MFWLTTSFHPEGSNLRLFSSTKLEHEIRLKISEYET